MAMLSKRHHVDKHKVSRAQVIGAPEKANKFLLKLVGVVLVYGARLFLIISVVRLSNL